MPFPQSLYCIWLKYCNKCKFHTAEKNWNNLYEKIRQNQNISCLVRTHFPAFYVSYMLLLWVLINSLYFLCSSWLARVIPLVWFYDTQLKATLNWINGGSNMDSTTRPDCYNKVGFTVMFIHVPYTAVGEFVFKESDLLLTQHPTGSG